MRLFYMERYACYANQIRQEIHRNPEIGYDLGNTLAVIRRELTEMGIPYTEKFGKSSIVGVINPEKAGFTIGIRADMDALPIQEQTQANYASTVDGVMHACGHDVHTAILLATAKKLRDMQEQINCCVKLLFTPAEEYAPPGCQLMAEDGVMEDIDCVVSCHVDPNFPVGSVAIDEGGQGGNSLGFTLEFFGANAHAAYQHRGKDAITMAVQAYTALEMLVAKEIDPVEPCLLNIGAFNGGHTNNIICDYCSMYGTLRTHSDEVNDYLCRRIPQIADGIAAMHGGRAQFTVKKFLPAVINDAMITQRMYHAAATLLGEENIHHKKRTLTGEDFSYLCRRKPGMMFRLGTNGGERTAYPIHNPRFDVDEGCFAVGIDLFVQFVLENMDRV